MNKLSKQRKKRVFSSNNELPSTTKRDELKRLEINNNFNENDQVNRNKMNKKHLYSINYWRIIGFNFDLISLFYQNQPNKQSSNTFKTKFKTRTMKSKSSLIKSSSVILYTKRVFLAFLLSSFFNHIKSSNALYLNPNPTHHYQLTPIVSASSSQEGAISSSSSSALNKINHVELAAVNAIAPTIDYSHNMRILKLPQTTQIGSIVYRLKGSDGDPNTKLTFGISGGFGIGRQLFDVVQVANSWNEADVYLRSQLEQTHYNLTVYVTDGNKTTQVESTVIVTDPTLSNNDSFGPTDNSNNSDNSDNYYNLQQTNLSLSSTTALLLNNNQAQINLSPFVNTKHVFHVPENTKLNEPIGFVSVLESFKSDLPVRFELRGKGSDKFSIRYVFGPKGQSKGEIILAHELDYEKQNLFTLKVLALNAWTNVRYDTRNVATMDIVVTIGDVQDTRPIFKYQSMPKSILVPNTAQAKTIVFKVEAEDGDYADQRPINYALDAQSPLANYFGINKQTGEIYLLKSANELALHAGSSSSPLWDSPDWSILAIFASEVPDTTSYDHLWPPMFSKLELPIIMVDVLNEPPQFVGGWQTNAALSATTVLNNNETTFITNKILHGYINEIPNQATSTTVISTNDVVRWYTNTSETGSNSLADELSKQMGGRPLVIDLGLGSNGTFELYLEGQDSLLFQIEPQFPVTKQTTFTITIDPSADKSQFDFEQHQQGATTSGGLKRTFNFDIVAKDFGRPSRKSSKINCLIELVDLNDNLPQFETDLYSFNVYENAQIGSLLGTIRARDLDNNNNIHQNRIKYFLFNNEQSIHNNVEPHLNAQNSRLQLQHQQIKSLFKLDAFTGQLILQNPLDREKKSNYLLFVGASDSSNNNNYDQSIMNYTQVLINVLDINDNAPIFSQDHYDAVLKSDGTFYQTLQVKAIDNDEPNTANSQVAYEIIAGNLNDQFSIDSVSGIIYSSITTQTTPSNENYLSSNNNNKNLLPQIPPVITEPIVPFNSNNGINTNNNNQAGKILPASHEIEETTYPTPRLISSNKIQQQHQNQSKLLSLANYDNQAQDRLVASGSSNSANGKPLTKQKAKITVEILSDNKSSNNSNKRLTRVIKSDNSDNKQISQQQNPMPQLDTDQLPGLDLLLNLESNQDSSSYLTTLDKSQYYDDDGNDLMTIDKNKRSLLNMEHNSNGNNYYQSQNNNIMKVPPITTLIVRAHDFGIPLRSSTVRVNIYNQALLSRSVSVLLNGTTEQLESRRDLLERAFSSVTGSKASLESIYSLSDSSSISVARFKLAVPQNSLVDLTDLTALMNALDYYHYNNHQLSRDSHQSSSSIVNAGGHQPVIHYIAAGDKLIPISSPNLGVSGPANITTTTTNVHGQQQAGLFNDIYSVALDNNNQLERRLLIFIIIAVFCIAILLLIWLIVYCCSKDNNQQQELKLIDPTLAASLKHQQQRAKKKGKISVESYKANGIGADEVTVADDNNTNETRAKIGGGSGASGLQSPIGNNLAKQRQLQQQNKQQQYNFLNMDRNSMMTNNSELLLIAPMNSDGSSMMMKGQQHLTTATNLLKPDRYSMYNGQVWFEPSTVGSANAHQPGRLAGPRGGEKASARRAQLASSRRASSAPSGSGSLDSALNSVINHKKQQQLNNNNNNNNNIIRDGSGQFFPNTIGYMENLNSLQNRNHVVDNNSRMFYRRNQKNKVAPMQLIQQDNLYKRELINKGVLTDVSGHVNKAYERDEDELEDINLIKQRYLRDGNSTGRSGNNNRRRETANKTTLANSSRSTSSIEDEEVDDEEEGESSLGADSNAVILDSNQELLGYDSTGTPIIATHTSAAPGNIIRINSSEPRTMKPILVDMMLADQQQQLPASLLLDDSKDIINNKSVNRAKQEENSNSNNKMAITNGASTRNKPNEQTNSINIEDENKSEIKKHIIREKEEGEAITGHVKKAKAVFNQESKLQRQKADFQGGDLMNELNDRLINRRKQSDGSANNVKVSSVSDNNKSNAGLINDEQLTKKQDVVFANEIDDDNAKRKPLEQDNADNNSKITVEASSVSGEEEELDNNNKNVDNKLEGASNSTLRDMKNGELLEKQSIFTITYSGLATDKLPV